MTNSVTFSEIPFLEFKKSLICKDFQSSAMWTWEATIIADIRTLQSKPHYNKHPWKIQPLFVDIMFFPFLPGISIFCKNLFTFPVTSCIVIPNRVGDLALSAIGTGSCPKDEGMFHDEITAPAVAYWTSSFM